MELALGLLVLLVVGALSTYAIVAGNRAARWRKPMPSLVLWIARILGLTWIVAAFDFGSTALAMFAGVGLGYATLLAWAVASAIAAPVSFLLGLLLLAQTRGVLLVSTLWAASVAIGVGLIDADDGSLGGATLVPLCVALLSLVAWISGHRSATE